MNGLSTGRVQKAHFTIFLSPPALIQTLWKNSFSVPYCEILAFFLAPICLIGDFLIGFWEGLSGVFLISAFGFSLVVVFGENMSHAFQLPFGISGSFFDSVEAIIVRVSGFISCTRIVPVSLRAPESV